MMEERFGRFGRPMTTLMLLAIFVAVVLWAISMIRSEFISPIIDAVAKGYGDEMVSSLVSWGIGVLLSIPVFFVGLWAARRFIAPGPCRA